MLGTGGTAGQVVSITITNAGSGYTAIPTVTFTNTGTGETTAATIGTVTGTVTGVTISNAGNGYATAPTYTFGAVSGATVATAGTVTLAGNQLIFTSVPTLTGTTGNTILPYAYVTSAGTTPTTATDFATYGTGASTVATNNGGAPNQLGIARFDNYSSGAINSATTGTVYKMTANQTLTTVPVVLNAVLINGTGLTLSGSGQGVYLSGGALLTTGGSNTVSVSSLDLGANEGIVITDGSSNTTTLSSSIIGTGGLTIAGTGTLSLPNSNATDGSVTNVPLAMTGSSYTAAPSVTFSGGGATTQATGYAVLSGNTVAAIVITSGGLGYTSAPTVVLGTVSGATAATLGTVTISIDSNSSTGSYGGAAGSYTGTTTVNTSVTLGANNAIPGNLGLSVQNGTFATGVAAVTALTSTANLFVGMPVTGAGIAAGTVIAAITGSTTITLSVNTTAVGTATPLTFINILNLTNGTITDNAGTTPLIIDNPVAFNPIISNITFTGSAGGSVQFNNNSTATIGAMTFAAAGGNTNVTVASGFTVTVGTPLTVGVNVITAAGSITKLGTGTLAIATGNVSATTVTTVEAGILLLQASGGLGATGGKAIIGNGATLQVQQISNATVSVPADPITVIGSGASGTTGAIQMLGGGTGANTILSTLTMLGDTTIGVDVGQLTLSGVVSGAATLNKVGLGMASLSGTNTYLGPTNITAGILEANAAAALGGITAGTVVTGGATLDVGAFTVVGKPVTLNGTGFGTLPGGGVSGLLTPRSALNFTGAGTWDGNIILNTSSVAIGTSGGAGIVNGVLSGSGVAFNKVNANTLTLNGANTFTGSVTVSAGNLTLGNANTYSGATTIGTTATLDLNNYGTIPNTSGITAAADATLLLDNSATSVLLNSRLASSVGITLNGATLQFNANNNLGMNSSQTVGSITLSGGQSTIQAGFAAIALAGNTSVFTSTLLVRTAGATVNFIGGTSNATPLGSSSNQLIFGNLLTTSSGTVGSFNSGLQYLGNQGNILPYAEVNGGADTGDFATYGSNGVAPFTNYATQSFGGVGTLSANAGDIVKVIAAGNNAYTINAAANLSIGALLLVNSNTGNQNITLSASGTATTPSSLTVSSGLIMNQNLGTATNIISGGVVNLGGEGILFQNDAGTATFNTPVTGSNGLTVAGPGTLTLAAANSITGATSLNQGVITLGSAASIGSGALTITGASTGTTTTLQGTQALTFTQAFTLNNANLTFGNGNAVPITFTGTGTLVGSNTLTITDTGGVYFNGQLTDGGSGNPGSLILAGAGTVLLNDGGTSNYLGGTLINMTGTVVAGDSTAFGSNTSSQTLGITAGTIVAGAALTLSQSLVLNGNFTLSGTSSANNITFATNALLTAGVTLTDSNLGTVTFSGNIGEAAGARALSIAGLGQLALSGTNTYSGGTTVNTLTAGSASGNLLVNTGATLSSPTSSNPLYSSSLGSGTLTLTSGVLQATGGALTYNNVVSIAAGPVVLAGTATTFNGTVGLSATATVLAANATTVNGIVTGAFGLTLSGVPIVSGTNTFSPTGSLALTASNTFTGVTTVSGGTLTVSGNGTLPSVPSTTASSNAAQTLTFAGSPSGSFTITFNGATTGNITYSTTVATLQSAIQTQLNSLLGTNNVTVSAATATSVLITFQNVLGDAPLPLMTTNVSGLNSGATATFASTTTGVSPITVNAGGTLTLDNSGTNHFDRLNHTGACDGGGDYQRRQRVYRGADGGLLGVSGWHNCHGYRRPLRQRHRHRRDDHQRRQRLYVGADLHLHCHQRRLGGHGDGLAHQQPCTQWRHVQLHWHERGQYHVHADNWHRDAQQRQLGDQQHPEQRRLGDTDQRRPDAPSPAPRSTSSASTATSAAMGSSARRSPRAAPATPRLRP